MTSCGVGAFPCCSARASLMWAANQEYPDDLCYLRLSASGNLATAHSNTSPMA